jgi:hypothetical protein
MKNKFKKRNSLIILYFLLLSCSFSCNSAGESKDGINQFKTIFKLSNTEIKVVNFEKVLQDPSYITPVNLYFKVEMSPKSFSKFIVDNSLINKKNTDVLILKKELFNLEFDNFFNMKGVNKFQSETFETQENSFKWWNKSKKNDIVFASSIYLTQYNIKLVRLNEKKNGKLCCFYSNGFAYIMIESWG